jgi:hypothetical protein
VATQTKQRVVVQSVLSPALAERLKAQAEAERRTISATVRLLIEDRLSGRLFRDEEPDPQAEAVAEIRALAAKRRKRNRPIKTATFEVQ